jgi:hypothetical protein
MAASSSGSTSRRNLLRGAAAGAAATAGGVTLSRAASAASASAADVGSLAFSFAGRIDQEGFELTGYGFLTEVSGIPDAVLFGDALDRTEAAARLTITGAMTFDRRTIRAGVFIIDAVGTMEVHSLEAPGASFDDPATFASGTVVAEYAATLHDILTVIAPDTGIPTLSGELVQTAAPDFVVDGAWYRIGSTGARLSFSGTGIGTRTDAELPRAFLDIAAQTHFV